MLLVLLVHDHAGAGRESDVLLLEIAVPAQYTDVLTSLAQRAATVSAH